MSNIKLKKHPKVAELLGAIRKGESLVLDGPQISTAFRTEILERVDCLIIGPNVPKDENQMKQIHEWLASGDFSVQDLGNKLAELKGGPSCVGNNETGRVFSKAWFKRIHALEKTTGYELTYSIYELWIAFSLKFKETKKVVSAKKEVANLKAQLAELQKENG